MIIEKNVNNIAKCNGIGEICKKTRKSSEG
jgi:hypothetical protein